MILGGRKRGRRRPEADEGSGHAAPGGGEPAGSTLAAVLRHIPATALCAATALVPLGLPDGVGTAEAAVVVGAALTGAYWPDAATEGGPGPLLRPFFGTAGEALRNASGGAGGHAASKTHAVSSAVLFSVLSAVLCLAGAAGIAAWAAASGAYLAHLAQDRRAGRHGVCLVPQWGRPTTTDASAKERAAVGTKQAPRTAPRTPKTSSGAQAALTRLFGAPKKKKKAQGTPKKTSKTSKKKKNTKGGSTGDRGHA